MIQINKQQLTKILNSKKDFLFFDIDKNNKVTNFVLTNKYSDYKKLYSNFRVVSTIQKPYEIITI